MKQRYSANFIRMREWILAGEHLTAPEMAAKLKVSVRRARELGNDVCKTLRRNGHIAAGHRLPGERLNQYGIWITGDETSRAVTPYQKNIVGHLREVGTFVETLQAALSSGEQSIATAFLFGLLAPVGELYLEIQHRIAEQFTLQPVKVNVLTSEEIEREII